MSAARSFDLRVVLLTPDGEVISETVERRFVDYPPDQPMALSGTLSTRGDTPREWRVELPPCDDEDQEIELRATVKPRSVSEKIVELPDGRTMNVTEKVY